MKKIISAGLAAILAASALSTAAFAEEFTMSAEGVLAKPALKITMPKSMAFVFNPYGLKVADAKGTINTSSENTATLLGSYKFDTTTGADTSGWVITNATGTAVKAAVYAYSIDKDATKFTVVDDAATAPTIEKYVKVGLQAKADDLDAVDVALQKAKLDTKTASIWDTANNSVVINSVQSKLVISFDEENCSVVKPATDTWTEKDAVKIDFIFGFELADGGSTAGGGGSSSYTGAAYTITWVAKNDATLNKDTSSIAVNTATANSDIATITAVADTDSYKAEVLKYTIKISDEETKTFNDAAALIAYLDGLDTRANVSVNVFAKSA